MFVNRKKFIFYLLKGIFYQGVTKNSTNLQKCVKYLK